MTTQSSPKHVVLSRHVKTACDIVDQVFPLFRGGEHRADWAAARINNILAVETFSKQIFYLFMYLSMSSGKVGCPARLVCLLSILF